ncbi:hypothetical protein [Acinetobacter vivianii]|uniref:hypothetical protein n=1 Tax=Acinetobacter vivianii TaxID=1776742 RepID=UPI004041B238
MKQKNNDNELTIAQIGWETLDSLGDKILEDVATEMVSDIFSAIPLSTVAIGIYKGYRSYKEKKKIEKFVEFIKSYKTNTDKEINKYLKDNPTSEVGEYTLALIEELSSLRQTEMLGRATALLLNQIINEDTFYEYGYIITKLDPHLFKIVSNLHEHDFKDKNGSVALKKRWEMLQKGYGYIINPNQDLLSFGFLEPIAINLKELNNSGRNFFPDQQFKVTFKYRNFYERIILGNKYAGSHNRAE